MSKFKKILIVSSGAILILATFFAILIFSGFLFARKNISYEADDALFSVAGRGGTRFFAYDDNEEVQEIELLSQNGVRKLKYNLNEISDYLKLGFIAMEDRDFYSHSGVNYKRTLGALANYVFRFSKLYGASTITQQVVKNISGDNEIKISRKLSEILRALHMEKMHSKDEILELYLNIVPMTDNMAGVGMGARAYFGKEPNELTLAESATIIGITNSPAKYNPYKHYNECLEKRNRVLYAMRECGVIDEDEYKSAAAEPINLKPKENITRGKNSWFIETVISDVLADFMQKYNINRTCANLLLTEGGYDIYTTQNIEMQRILDEYFSNTENFPNAIENGLNYAMAITDSTSGNLLAIYGSSGEKKAERILNYATVNVTPGSVIKPLSLYAPLLDAGKINWATLFEDAPVSITKKGDKYVLYPRNYPDVYEGLIPMHTALKNSKNTVALRLYGMLSAEDIYYSLKNDFGFDSLVREVYNKNGEKITDVAPAPLALGQLSYGVSLRKLTSAYTVFPSEGVYRSERSYTEVYDHEGNLVLENKPRSKRVMRAQTARIMNKLLEEVTESGTARSVTLKNIVDTAGKTGTSGNDLDRLFIGYTPYVTAGIWCGYREGNKPVGNHSPSHLKIWDGVMIKIHEYLLKNNETPIGFSTEGLEYVEYSYDMGGEVITEYGYFERGNTTRGKFDIYMPASIDLCRAGFLKKRKRVVSI